MNKRVAAVHGPNAAECSWDLASSDDDLLINSSSAVERDVRNKYTTFPRDLGAEVASIFLKPHYCRLQGLGHTNNKLHQVSKLPYISWSICTLRVHSKYTIIWVNWALIGFTLTYSKMLPWKGHRSGVPPRVVSQPSWHAALCQGKVTFPLFWAIPGLGFRPVALQCRYLAELL